MDALTGMTPAVAAMSLLVGGLLCAGLQLWLGGHRQRWLFACLISAGLYVIISVRLDQPPGGGTIANAFRWGLLLTTLFSFYRFRFRTDD